MSTETEEPRTGRDRPSGLPSWLLLVLPGLLLSFLALRVIAPVKDPDAYWHIASGDHLRTTWDFVVDDPFGAAAEKPWILNQWLPQLAMSYAHEFGGMAGVVWLTVLGTFGVMAAYYASCRRRSSTLVATLVVALAFLAASGSIAPRPQLVTFALTAIATGAWLCTAEDHKPRWWLIPLTWVWACSHGMWFMGPVVGVATLVGMLLSGRLEPRAALRLGLIPVGSVAAAAITPVGPVLLTSPFQVSGVTAYISEWQPPSPTSAPFLAAMFLILVVLMDASRSGQGRAVHILLLAALAVVLAVTYTRTAAVAAAIVAPLSAAALTRLTRQSVPTVSHRETGSLAGLGVATVALAALVVPSAAGKPGLGANEFNAELAALPEGTVVCNDWTDGGWLILKYPNVRVTMDSRVEIYSVEHIRSYSTFLDADPGWQSYVKETGCSAALLRAETAIAGALRSDENWRVVAAGTGYVLFTNLRD